MLITALTKFTTIDFPGKLACIIFTGGCNLRCGFCHNPEFVMPEKLAEMKKSAITFESVMSFLKARQGMLEGVVICGGEPTVQPDLIEKIRELKSLGYAVKLDTNGLNPEKLEEIIQENLVDYIAMDIKDVLPYRKDLIGVNVNPSIIRRSIKIIINSGIRHEFRSTILPAKHNLDILKKMAGEIVNSEKWILQRFRSIKTLNSNFRQMKEFTPEEMRSFSIHLQKYSRNLEIRI